MNKMQVNKGDIVWGFEENDYLVHECEIMEWKDTYFVLSKNDGWGVYAFNDGDIDFECEDFIHFYSIDDGEVISLYVFTDKEEAKESAHNKATELIDVLEHNIKENDGYK